MSYTSPKVVIVKFETSKIKLFRNITLEKSIALSDIIFKWFAQAM